MKGAKKDKKNGKDGGGVVAAVTKHTAGKFSYVLPPGATMNTLSPLEQQVPRDHGRDDESPRLTH